MKRSRVTFATIDAAAIAALVASPSTIARWGRPNSATEKPSSRHSTSPCDAVGDAAHRVAQRGQVGLVQPAGVDAAHAARDDHDAGGAAQHERVQLLARLDGVLLGVVERAQQRSSRVVSAS